MGKRAQTGRVAIVAGELRGRVLVYPAGSATRPTTQRTRGSVFDSLGPRVRGAVFADLFAGAGAMGIEALSRGASYAHFVESGGEAVACLRANLAALALLDRARVHAMAVGTVLDLRPCPLADATIVFADAPYDDPAAAAGLLNLRAAGLDRLEMLVVEHRSRNPVPVPIGMRLERERRFGDTALAHFVPATASG